MCILTLYTYHSIIKLNSVDVKYSTYINHRVLSNDKDPKFEVGDRVRISKYKDTFTKDYALNWFKKFLSKKIKNTVPGTYGITDLNGE